MEAIFAIASYVAVAVAVGVLAYWAIFYQVPGTWDHRLSDQRRVRRQPALRFPRDLWIHGRRLDRTYRTWRRVRAYRRRYERLYCPAYLSRIKAVHHSVLHAMGDLDHGDARLWRLYRITEACDAYLAGKVASVSPGYSPFNVKALRLFSRYR